MSAKRTIQQPGSPQPALVVPVDPVDFLRAIKHVAPTVGRIAIRVPTVIGLATLAEAAQGEMERRIREGLKKKTKREKKDNQQVIKVKDAIDCVENSLRDYKQLLQLGKEIINAVTLRDVRTIINIATDTIAQCIRENALRQDTPRVLATTRYYQRPARGHGHGR